MKLTDIAAPDYFHKVVDCQWACPAHTPVPEYIRLISAGRYGDAYMVNWKSNVFPGILGRTCDRPCEPACRRGRVEKDPVAICRLKRVAADYKEDITERLPKAVAKDKRNGKRIALVGAGPASLTVARDLAPMGYECVVFDGDFRSGGMMRSQIPKFRLPDKVIDEECNYILNLGVEFRGGRPVNSLKALLAEGWDAVFVGSGAPRGRELNIPGREEAKKNIHIGIDWLSSVSFGHINKIGKRVIVLGGGNTAMDCCRSSRRLGGEDVKVIVRSGFEEMKASPWEKEDAHARGHPDPQFPRAEGIHPRQRQAHRRHVREGEGRVRRQGPPQAGALPASRTSISNATTCWSRSARRTRSPGSSATSGSSSTNGTCRRSIRRPSRRPTRRSSSAAMRRSARRTSSGRWRTATRPRSRSTSSSSGEDVNDRPLPAVEVVSQKMGIHEWSYDNDIAHDKRYRVPTRDNVIALKDIRTEVELGYDDQARLPGSAALPELRRADRVHRPALHRVRRLRRYLPDGLHHLHAERRGSRAAHAAEGAGART